MIVPNLMAGGLPEPGTFAARFWTEHHCIAEQALQTSFVQALVDGSLPSYATAHLPLSLGPLSNLQAAKHCQSAVQQGMCINKIMHILIIIIFKIIKIRSPDRGLFIGEQDICFNISIV